MQLLDSYGPYSAPQGNLSASSAELSEGRGSEAEDVGCCAARVERFAEPRVVWARVDDARGDFGTESGYAFWGGEAMMWEDFRKRCFRSDGSGLQIRNYLVSEVFAAQEAIDERRYGLSQFLILAWPREAWDPRDKVFSRFGLLPAQPFEVDYERSIRDVYVAATRACITTEKNLRVLNAAGLLGTPSPIPTSVEDSKCPYFGTCSHANGHCSPGSPTPPPSIQREFPSWVPDYRASGCKDTVAQTDWYMTVRNVDSAHIDEATTFQAVDDTSNCLLLAGLVLGRFSSHASFKTAPIYAKDGVTEIAQMVHAGAFVEFPYCTVKYFNHSTGFKAAVSEEEQALHISRFAQAVRQHDRQNCECSEKSRKRPVEPIYSVADGILPPHCTDGDWLCILDGAATPSILRPMSSVSPSVSPSSQPDTPGCRYPSFAAFAFVGNMRNPFYMGPNDYVELMGISTDALVTYMDAYGVANVQSRSQAREELARSERGSRVEKKRYQKRLQAMRRRRGVRAVRGVLHLH